MGRAPGKPKKLPPDTPDLAGVLDLAGTFWLVAGEYLEALRHYEDAVAVFPQSTRFLGGWGYALGKLGRHAEAVVIQRRAVAVEPQNAGLLSDHGWTLVESGEPAEAEAVLQLAVRLAPPEHERPRNNLEQLRRMRRPDR